MLVTCWSAKGGSGTTTVAVALARMLAARADDDAVLVDLAGDVPAVLGRPEPEGPGVAEWLAAGAHVPADALARLEVPGAPGVRVVPRGRGCLADAGRAEVLVELLAADARPVVVDAGTLAPDRTGGEVAARFVAGASRSLLVMRPCYLAMKRAMGLPVRASGIVLVTDVARTFTPDALEAYVGVPVVSHVPCDERIAKAVDGGSLGLRVPRPLERALRWAA